MYYLKQNYFMEYIRWKEDLSVDNEFIDGQHKELFRYINAFYESIAAQANKSAVTQVIKDLENYTKVHFTAEEAMMQRAGYPELDRHKLEHKKFIDTVSDYRQRHEEGRLLLSLEVTSFIKEWITNHIKQTDRRYKGQI
jgi:hemerythrin